MGLKVELWRVGLESGRRWLGWLGLERATLRTTPYGMASWGEEEPFSRLALLCDESSPHRRALHIPVQILVGKVNLCYRECFCKTNCWQELHFEFSRQNLNRNVHSPSLWWWLITQPRPIWKKAPPGLQRPSRTDSGISGVLYWPKPSVPHLGPDPRYPWA